MQTPKDETAEYAIFDDYFTVIYRVVDKFWYSDLQELLKLIMNTNIHPHDINNIHTIHTLPYILIAEFDDTERLMIDNPELFI